MAKEQPREQDDEQKPDEARPEENPPPQTWKHDDSRELSDLDQERPLKP